MYDNNSDLVVFGVRLYVMTRERGQLQELSVIFASRYKRKLKVAEKEGKILPSLLFPTFLIKWEALHLTYLLLTGQMDSLNQSGDRYPGRVGRLWNLKGLIQQQDSQREPERADRSITDYTHRYYRQYRQAWIVLY